MIHYEEWSKDYHAWIFAARHDFPELRNEAWTTCKRQVYAILGKPDGVRKLIDQGLSLDALSIVVSELVNFYCRFDPAVPQQGVPRSLPNYVMGGEFEGDT